MLTKYKLVPLTSDHLDTLGVTDTSLHMAYLSFGSAAYCLLDDDIPVFAGGIVNMQWHRGEAWMLPTTWFKAHVKTCFEEMKYMLPAMAIAGGFRRVQATCIISVSPSLFRHLGFYSEGIMNAFGPNGESCHMYARLFI